MSKVYFISDLHLGHKSILKFSPSRGGQDCKTHAEWLVKQWNSVVTKRDLVWVLGDICFDNKFLPYLKKMNGSKHLILGNHDKFMLSEYAKYFNKIHGFIKYKGFWLSHSPIYAGELRNQMNIHGHVHNNSVPDKRYINVCVEALNGVPIEFTKIVDSL